MVTKKNKQPWRFTDFQLHPQPEVGRTRSKKEKSTEELKQAMMDIATYQNKTHQKQKTAGKK
jgi:hypothetical protein